MNSLVSHLHALPNRKLFSWSSYSLMDGVTSAKKESHSSWNLSRQACYFSSPNIHNRYRDQEPRMSSESPTWVWGLEFLDQLLLPATPSGVLSRELEQVWSSQGSHWSPFGVLAWRQSEQFYPLTPSSGPGLFIFLIGLGSKLLSCLSFRSSLIFLLFSIVLVFVRLGDSISLCVLCFCHFRLLFLSSSACL